MMHSMESDLEEKVGVVDNNNNKRDDDNSSKSTTDVDLSDYERSTIQKQRQRQQQQHNGRDSPQSKLSSPSSKQRWANKAQKAYSASASSSFEDNFSDEILQDGSIKKKKRNKSGIELSEVDLSIVEQLDADYMRAIEERDIGWNARQESVRQNAGFSFIFMVLYLLGGTLYLDSLNIANLTIGQNLLFSIMSITTVGYSSLVMMDTTDTTNSTNSAAGTAIKTPSFQLFMIVYILIGVATLTIMVAQVYQYIVLETERARFHQETRKFETSATTHPHADLESNHHHHNDHDHHNSATRGIRIILRTVYPLVKHFLRYNECGQVIVVLSPFLGLTFIGALVVGTVEGWTFVESIYFAIVSLTTVGFGDYVPTKSVSIWFCVFWLPTSIGFMSFYLGLVGYWYLQLSSKNVKRILRKKRQHYARIKRRRQMEFQQARIRALAAAGLQDETTNNNNNNNTTTTTTIHNSSSTHVNNNNNNDDDDENNQQQQQHQLIYDTSMRNTSSHSTTRKSEAEEIAERGERRRQRIIQNTLNFNRNTHHSNSGGGSNDGMQSMREMIQAVRYNSSNSSSVGEPSGSLDTNNNKSHMSSKTTGFLTLKAVDKIEMGKEIRKKPTFALRVLVQERLADIIAVDVAGYQNRVDRKDTTLSITMNQLIYVEKKWNIPRLARNVFREVAFETLYFIGEHALITRGSDALFDLTPFEFHKLFAPLIASMGDFDTMNRWLSSTEVLAEADLKRSSRYIPLSQPNNNIHHNYDDDDDDDNDHPFESHTIT